MASLSAGMLLNSFRQKHSDFSRNSRENFELLIELHLNQLGVQLLGCSSFFWTAPVKLGSLCEEAFRSRLSFTASAFSLFIKP
jgi:hypothetical protein